MEENTQRRTRKRQPSIHSQQFAISGNESEESNQNDREGSDDDSSSMNSSSDTTEVPNMQYEFNPKDYLITTIQNALDAVELDKSIVLQAQVSGMLNSKNLEIIELQKKVQQRFISLNELVAAKVGNIKTMQKNLAWSERHIKRLNLKVKEDFPIEFNQAREKVLERSVDDDI